MLEQSAVHPTKIKENSPVAKFIDPASIIKQIEIQSGMTVADFGCGTGYFSLPLARQVGDSGAVYALDIMPEHLESVQSQAKNLNLNNIVVQRANLEKENGSRLDPQSVDWVILKDILFQNKEKQVLLKEAARIAKSTGKILVIEWDVENSTIGIGPAPGFRVPKETVMTLAQESGLEPVGKVDAGNFHYGVVFAKIQ